MKQINYSGSSKLIARIVHLLNRKVPLPLDGSGDPAWGSNGQVLTTDGTGATYWSAGGGGGDSVTWTQVQQSGTKIAEIEINGTTQDVYAPNGGSTYTEGDGIDITNNAISVDTTFTEASTRANIASGDTLATIWGKIKKFFSDLKTVAFSGSYNDLSNKPTIPTDFVSKANGGKFGGNVGVNVESGTTSSYGLSFLILGNNKPLGTDKNSFGVIRFYGGSSFCTDVSGVNSTRDRTITLPDKDGTFALTSDIETKTVKSSTTPTYNSQIASEFASGSNDNLTLYTLSNGMRVMNGLFLVTATQAASTDKLFDIPSEYVWTHEGYSNQYWITAINIATKEAYTVRITSGAYAWGQPMPAGTYLIHAVF